MGWETDLVRKLNSVDGLILSQSHSGGNGHSNRLYGQLTGHVHEQNGLAGSIASWFCFLFLWWSGYFFILWLSFFFSTTVAGNRQHSVNEWLSPKVIFSFYH